MSTNNDDFVREGIDESKRARWLAEQIARSSIDELNMATVFLRLWNIDAKFTTPSAAGQDPVPVSGENYVATVDSSGYIRRTPIAKTAS